MNAFADSAVCSAVLDAIPGSAYVLAADGTVVETLTSSDVLGVRDVDAEDSTLGDVLTSDSATRVHDRMSRTGSGGDSEGQTCVGEAATTGDWYQFRLTPVESSADTQHYVLALVEETTLSGDIPQSVVQEAFDQAPVGVVLTDPTAPDNPIVYANQTFVEMSGYSRPEIVGRNCRFLQGEATRDSQAQQLRDAVDAGEPVTVELRNYRKDGTEFWNRVSISPVGTGEDRRFVGFQSDITARKERERELHERQESIQTIVDHVPMVGFAYDDEGVFVRSQGSALEQLGLEPGEAVGTSVFDLFADHEQIIEHVERSLAGEAVDATVEVDGVTFESWYKPLFDDGGEVEEVVGFSLDISDRRARERDLELKNRAIDEAPVGITIHDATEQGSPVVFANTAFQALTGYDQEAVRSRPLSLLEGKETDSDRLRTLETALEDREAASVTLLLYRNDGTPFWGRVSVSPVTHDGEVTNLVSFLQDVTDEKEYEQEIERRLNEFGELLAEELRNPLSVAESTVNAARDGEANGDLDDAVTALSQMDSLIADITTVHSFSVKSREQSVAMRTDPDRQH